mgnify:CR=1 FL=1
MALRPKHKRFEGFGRRLLGVSLGRGGDDNNENDKNIMFSQNDIPVKKHIPCRGTAAVHCITLYESVGNPGHSSRSLRNHISFAMQIVVRNGHLASSGPKPGHRVVCVAMGPHRGPMGPQGGAPGIHAPARAPRRPESLVRCILAFPTTPKPW